MCQSHRVKPSARSFLPVRLPLETSTRSLGIVTLRSIDSTSSRHWSLLGHQTLAPWHLARRKDPGLARRVLAEGEAAKRPDVAGVPGVIKVDRVFLPVLEPLRKRQRRPRLPPVSNLERLFAKENLVHRKRGAQVELDLVSSMSIRNRIVFLPLIFLLFGINAHVEVVVEQVVVRAIRSILPAARYQPASACADQPLSWSPAPRPSSPPASAFFCSWVGGAAAFGVCASTGSGARGRLPAGEQGGNQKRCAADGRSLSSKRSCAACLLHSKVAFPCCDCFSGWLAVTPPTQPASPVHRSANPPCLRRHECSPEFPHRHTRCRPDKDVSTWRGCGEWRRPDRGARGCTGASLAGCRVIRVKIGSPEAPIKPASSC